MANDAGRKEVDYQRDEDFIGCWWGLLATMGYICGKSEQMAELKYPIGIQTFSKIIENGYTYVDKTRFVGELTTRSKYVFLNRPRRFGKSLFTSTLHCYFDGRRDLFKGLVLDSMDVDWTPHPVLHFDFNNGNYEVEEGIHDILDYALARYERRYGCDGSAAGLSIRFQSLIERAYEKTGRGVVILIDEYDKPLLGLEDNPEIFERNRAVLKSFFGTLKTMDRYIRFAFLTGVARFSKVSIFSDLNQLQDISIDDRYADICGWTEEELIETFLPGVRELAALREETVENTVAVLRNYYDGYKFSANGSRLYNPFSVLRALEAKSVQPYWFATGTPTFLAKRVKSSGLGAARMDGIACDEEELLEVGLGKDNPVPLMFQTGYLTIDSYDSRRRRYILRFPNQEVEIGFSKFLLPVYVPEATKRYGPFSIFSFQDDLYDGHPEQFMERLGTLFKDFPYEDMNEVMYRSVTYLICRLCDTEPQAERHSFKGRSDLEVLTTNYVYLFEFKYDESAEVAIAQIHERDYGPSRLRSPSGLSYRRQLR